MKYNHAKAKNIFEKRWESLRKLYKESGMSDEDIEQMYRYDLLEFNSTRRFMEHNCYLDEMTEDDYEKISPQDDESVIKKEASRYWWINEIEDETIVDVLHGLSETDIEIITMYAYENYSQEEIGESLNLSQQYVSKCINHYGELMGKSSKTEK